MVLFVLKSAFWHFMSSLVRRKKTLMHIYIFTGEMAEEFGDTMFQGALWYANGQDSM